MLFNELWLKAGLLRSLENIGYKEATPIQEQVMKIAMSGKNIVWQSQTGTGKTAAFLLPILNKIDTNKRWLQTLILAPTRELVVQIGEEIRNLTKFYGVSFVCLYGGASPFIQKRNLKKDPSIIIATPGRLMDFMNQKIVNIGIAEYFILDEVDRMLDMGFVRDIKKIRSQLRNVKQTFTFSATMNNDMKNIIKEHVSQYEFIKIWEEITVDKIDHTYMTVEHEQKLHNLINLIKKHKEDKVIIFTHTKRNTDTIHKILLSKKINAGMLNGNMSQWKRQGTLNEFKEAKIQVLVTTDVAARWLNMENVGLVVNFDVPIDAKSYIHRIWRTGRAGANGKAIMLVSSLETPLLKEIEKIHKISIKHSEHIAEKDLDFTYQTVRLNKSTDKAWGRRGGPQTWKKSNERRFHRKRSDNKYSEKRTESRYSRDTNKKSEGKYNRNDSKKTTWRYWKNNDRKPEKRYNRDSRPSRSEGWFKSKPNKRNGNKFNSERRN